MALRVGLTQRVEIVGSDRERRDALDQSWGSWLEQNGLVPVPIPNQLTDVRAYAQSMSFDLVILTGGNDLAHLPAATNAAPERDRMEQALLDLATAGAFPVLGVCRGLQALVHHAGGSLVKIEGHVGQCHTLTVSDESPWPLDNDRLVNSFHHWGIERKNVGRDLEPIGFAPDGTVEAVCHVTLPLCGIMWHPERTPAHRSDTDLLRMLLRRGR